MVLTHFLLPLSWFLLLSAVSNICHSCSSHTLPLFLFSLLSLSISSSLCIRVSFPLSACLTLFHPLYFPFLFVSLSFPLCLSHCRFPCLFSSLLVSVFFSNSLALIFPSQPVSLSFALSVVLSFLSLFHFLPVSLNFFLPLFYYCLTLISTPGLSLFLLSS